MRTRSLPITALLALAACAAEVDDAEVDRAAARTVGTDPPPTEPCPTTNPCVTRTWNGTRCVDAAVPSGTACFDGNLCDGTSTCRSGRCVSDGVPLSCDDHNACTIDSCQPATGCVSVATSGGACSDGSSCTVADVCRAGRCEGFGNTQGVPTIPSFTDVTVSAPFGEMITRGGLRYVEGNSIDIRATLPGCAYVTGVELDGAPLGTAPGLTGHYEIVWAFPRTNGTLDTIVRVSFGALGGSGDAVDVTLIATSAVGVERHTVRVSRVADVVPANAATQRLRMTISETTLMNSVIQQMYARYGDAGSFSYDAERVLIRPDYAGTVLAIDATGITFSSRITIDATCHPNARVSGKFVLVKEPTRIGVQWLEGPTAPITIDAVCNVLTVGLVDILADLLQGDEVIRMAMDEISAQIDAALGAGCDAACRSQIVGFEYAPHALTVVLRPSVDAVVVDLPYDARVAPGAPIGRGIPVTNAESYLFLGLGTSTLRECATGATSPVCGDEYVVAADGTFVWEAAPDAGNGCAIPDPWSNPGGPATYFGQRAEARARLRGAYRPRDELPFSWVRAGAVVFASSTSRLGEVTAPCRYVPASRDELLRFGVNEPAHGYWGSGTRRVAMLFVPARVGELCH